MSRLVLEANFEMWLALSETQEFELLNLFKRVDEKVDGFVLQSLGRERGREKDV